LSRVWNGIPGEREQIKGGREERRKGLRELITFTFAST
jgi:hypothetical protein